MPRPDQKTISFPVPRTLANKDGTPMTGKDFFFILEEIFSTIWNEIDGDKKTELLGNFPFEFTILNTVIDNAFIHK